MWDYIREIGGPVVTICSQRSNKKFAAKDSQGENRRDTMAGNKVHGFLSEGKKKNSWHDMMNGSVMAGLRDSMGQQDSQMRTFLQELKERGTNSTRILNLLPDRCSDLLYEIYDIHYNEMNLRNVAN
jgi:hypothetical protein